MFPSLNRRSRFSTHGLTRLGVGFLDGCVTVERSLIAWVAAFWFITFVIYDPGTALKGGELSRKMTALYGWKNSVVDLAVAGSCRGSAALVGMMCISVGGRVVDGVEG